MAIWCWDSKAKAWFMVADYQTGNKLREAAAAMGLSSNGPIPYLPPRRPPEGDENWCVTYGSEEKYLTGLSFIPTDAD